jgi:thiaminase/transcriptional activator TenA
MTEEFSEMLKQASQPAWTKAVEHRFVVELLGGTISDKVMASYLVQDHRFLDSFLTLLGSAIATADTFEGRLRLGRFAGMISSEENTYFHRALDALGVTQEHRNTIADAQPTRAFQAIMLEAADTRCYAAALAVLIVAEWLYLDWASRATMPLPKNFVHAEWIRLHDNPQFRDFVTFLQSELNRVGPAEAELCQDFFLRTVALELAFFDAAFDASDKTPRF